ncbi:MAG: DUF3180 domain-containing protein [Nocardioidaceae bacterium]
MGSSSTPPPPGTVRPTRLSPLVAVLVLGAALGYAFAVLSEKAFDSAPRVEWIAVAALLIVGGMLLVLARSTYRTLHVERRAVDVHRTSNLLVLARASAIVGALVTGGYLGFGLHFVAHLDIPLLHQQAVRSAAASLAGVLIVVSGLLLERACRVPTDDEK